MIERRDEPDVPRKQHAVAEHVARHVADPCNGEIRRLRVDSHFTEMPLRRLPGTARGDAHRLVVVAHRAAGRERIAQPEAVLHADRVCVVGKRRRPLVRGNNEVRIVGIVALDLRRRHNGLADTVVREVEQPAQIILITGDPFLHERLAVG